MKQTVLYIVFLLFFANISFSQNNKDTLKIEEVLISAKYPKEQAGINKTQVDSLILQKAVNLSLSDLISESTPIFVKNNGRGAMSTVSFRGTAASHTDLLWNGMSIKDPMLGQVDFSLVPVFFIDKLSLKHGASSISDVSGALGGSISIDNKPNWSNKFSAKFIQGIGSYSTFNEFAKMDFGTNDFQSKTALFYTYSKNNFKFLNKNIADIDPVTGEYIYPEQENKNADYKQYGFLQEFYFKAKNKNFFSLKIWSQWNNRSLPSLNTYEGNYYSNINKQTDITHRIVAKWTKYFNKKTSLSFRSGFSYKSLEYYLKNFISGQDYVNAVYSVSSSKSSLNNLNFKYKINKKTSLIAKYDFIFNNVLTKDTVKKTSYEKDRIKQSLFISLHRKFGEKLATSLMVRQENVDKVFTPFIPSLGFDYFLSEKNNLIIKGIIAKNYHLPSLNDLYWQPGGNKNLKPEKGFMGELSMSASKKINTINVNGSVTTFYSNISDWIIWLPSPQGFWVPENIKQVKTNGIEAYLKTNANFGEFSLKINISYALTNSINYGEKEKWGTTSLKKQLPYVPVHSGNIFFSLLYNGFSISYLNNSYSERYTTSSNDFTLRDWLYPYYMNNLFFGKQFKIKNTFLNVELKIYNLFNERYRTVLGRAMPQRNYLLLLSYKF